MKAGAFLLALLWFSGATYAGYRLTERSFSEFLESTTTSTAPGSAAPLGIDLKALEGKVPPQLLEQAKTLTPQQMLCLRASIAADRVSAVLAGDITPQEAAAAKKCLD